jgi:hypothetical protein
MAKGYPRGLARGNKAKKDSNTIRLTLDEALTFTGATGAAVFATKALEGLPEGNILLLGAVSNLTFTGPTSANLANDFQGDYSIGTAPTADNDLSDTNEANIIASTPIPAATAEVSANVRATNATQAIIDNTAGDMEVNLNVLLDADEVTNGEDVDITVTGTVDIAYIVLGDD